MYGAGGSGLITPRFGMSPLASGASTPTHGGKLTGEVTQHKIDAAFDLPRVSNEGITMNS